MATKDAKKAVAPAPKGGQAKAEEIKQAPIDAAPAAEAGSDVATSAPNADGGTTAAGSPTDTAPAQETQPGAPETAGKASEEPEAVLATELSAEAKLAVIEVVSEMGPGGEHSGDGDYVVRGISRHFKVTPEAVAAEIESAKRAAVEKSETVVIEVPRRFDLRLPNGTLRKFMPGTTRVSREVAEHPYVKASGCKIV